MPVMEIEPSPDHRELARLLGSRKDGDFSHSLKGKVRVWKRRLKRIAKPKLIYQSHKVKGVSQGRIYLSGNRRLKSPNLSKTLKDSKEIICFLGTIGARIENEINRLMGQKRISEAYVLDALASATVENLAEQFQSSMRKEYQKKDKLVSLRFSPGYCDWPLTEQKRLFQLFDSERVGVELTDSCVMKPRKSISGVFGIFHCPDVQKEYTYNPCWECAKTDCPFRRS